MSYGVKEPEVELADPGHEIEVEALRDIYFGVRGTVDSLMDALRDQLEIGDGSEFAEADLYLELRDHNARSVATTIESVDLIWRLAWIVAEMTPAELPSSGGKINIDTLIPSEAGLLIERVTTESPICIRFQRTGAKIWRAVVALSIVTSVVGVDARDAVSLVVQQPNQAPCYVKVIEELGDEPTVQLKKVVPGIAPDSVVKITIPPPPDRDAP